tara:strand:+ start:107 stop:403 length:297 start_codon:yes stop_codon:yes gene_type:complete
MIKELIKLANHLDSIGLLKEADFLDKIVSESRPIREPRVSSEEGVDRIAKEEGNELMDVMDATDEGELENCWLQFDSWPDWIQRAIINRVIQEGLDDT